VRIAVGLSRRRTSALVSGFRHVSALAVRLHRDPPLTA